MTPEERRAYLGASEIAAACGLSEWLTPTGLALRKLGLIDERDPGEAAEWGNVLEPLILDRYDRTMGCRTTRPTADAPLAYAHPDVPWLRGHLDALTDGERTCPHCGLVGAAVVDAKNPGWRAGADWGETCSEDVPIEYFVQMQVYCALTGRAQADLAVLIEKRSRVYHVRYDAAFVVNLIRLATPLWEMIQRGEHPPLDGSEESRRYANVKAGAHVDAKRIPATDDIERLALEYRDAHESESKASERKSAARNQLATLIGDAERVDGNGYYLLFRSSAPKPKTDYESAAQEMARKLGEEGEEVIARHTTLRTGPRILRPNWNQPKGKRKAGT